MSADAAPSPGEIVLVRHAQTEWSVSGRHTGRTDIPLTDEGRAVARALAPSLAAWSFELVLVSPSRRARETCSLAGLADRSQTRDELLEWDYGDYEGLTTPEIERLRAGWSLWRDGCPGGEDVAQVADRADRVIAELGAVTGAAAVFSHGHMLRVLGARWAGLDPSCGSRLGLAAGGRCVLGHEHDTPILARWNLPPAPARG
jgi:probable phosphoglycerate mutase